MIISLLHKKLICSESLFIDVVIYAELGDDVAGLQHEGSLQAAATAGQWK